MGLLFIVVLSIPLGAVVAALVTWANSSDYRQWQRREGKYETLQD